MSRFSEENYLGSPLWDMAAEKRRNIHSAYALLTGREAAAPESPAAASAVPDCVSTRIRDLLNKGNLEEANGLLMEQPDRDSNPEWLYLRGICAWKRGWMDEAGQFVRRAADAVPSNQEYQNAVEKFCAKPSAFSQPTKGKQGVCSKFDCAACSAECCCECVCESICESIDC
ncbi:MAG: tetratricopeptide repeat protein [Oscillospiraceae bacterium]|nr:tetratricopeptide repeat protein [Oscillospiraceae bacterium]